MKTFLRFIGHAYILVGMLLVVTPVIYLVVVSTPEIWYRINSGATAAEVQSLSRNPFAADSDAGISLPTITNDYTPITEVPPINSKLPKGIFIKIPSIGVNTQIHEGTDTYKALEKGVWRMPEFGSPANSAKPTILAAHRWGYNYYTDAFRKQHLFYNLPNIKDGAEITIYWHQREYVYRVVTKEENTYVSRLSDLILITCQFVDRPERIIVYAERIK